MRPDIEALTYFGQVAAALDLTAEQKQRAWDYMTKSNVGTSDPTSVFFCILAKMDGLSSSMSGDVVEKVRQALTEEMREQLATLPDELTSALDARMSDGVAQLVQSADRGIEREAARRQQFRLAAYVGGAAIFGALLFGNGYILGRDAVSTEAAKWSALVNLPDGGKWLTLATFNDLDKALAQSCGPNDGRVISGAKVCNLELFTTKPVATSKGADYVRLSLAEYAVKLGWLGYGLAALMGLAVGKLWRSKA